MNELHDYKILLNKVDPNKADSRLHGEKYKFGTQSSNKYLTHVCRLPSTDVGPEDASGRRIQKAAVLAMLTFWWMRQKISVQGNASECCELCKKLHRVRENCLRGHLERFHLNRTE